MYSFVREPLYVDTCGILTLSGGACCVMVNVIGSELGYSKIKS